MTKRLFGFTATSAFALLLAVGAQANVSQTSAGGDQSAIAVQDSLNDNTLAFGSYNGSGNEVVTDSNNDASTNNSQTAVLGSQAAGQDTNVDSHNTYEDNSDHSINDSQFAYGGQAAGNDALSLEASNGSQVAGNDAVMDSYNDYGTTVTIGDVSFNLTEIASSQYLHASVTNNQVRIKRGGLTTGSIFAGSGNFDSFAGINSQNLNSGALSVGLNANAVNVHGTVTIGN